MSLRSSNSRPRPGQETRDYNVRELMDDFDRLPPTMRYCAAYFHDNIHTDPMWDAIIEYGEEEAVQLTKSGFSGLRLEMGLPADEPAPQPYRPRMAQKQRDRRGKIIAKRIGRCPDWRLYR